MEISLQERRAAPNIMALRKTVSGRADVINFPCALKQNNSFHFSVVALLRVRQFFKAALSARISRHFDRVVFWSVTAFNRALK